MKYKWITTIITAGLLGNGIVLADDKDKPSDRGPGQGHPDREEMRKRILEKFDKDGDGKLNEAEQAEAREAGKKRAEEFFANIDKNGDGKISQDEAPEEMWNNLSKADKDGDGAVSKEELAAARAARGGQDGPGKPGGPKDGAGKPFDPRNGADKPKGPRDGADKPKGPRDGRGNPVEKFDKNGDGLVSGEELKQAHENRPDADSGKPGKPRKPKDSDS